MIEGLESETGVRRMLVGALVVIFVAGVAFVAVETALGNTPSKPTIIGLAAFLLIALAVVLTLEITHPGGRARQEGRPEEEGDTTSRVAG